MTDAPKRRGRPPKSATQAQADIVDEAHGKYGEDDELRVQDADEDERIKANQAAAPAHEQQTTRRRGGDRRIGELELGGLKAEAWEAYDMQDERVRFDTLNRKWTFRPEQTNGHAEMQFELRRGEDVREKRLSMAGYGTETAREDSDQAVVDLDGAL